jgi:uroporphyrinogen-III decarboxylase
MGDIRPLLDQIADYPFDALAFEEGRKGYQQDVGTIQRALGDDRVLFGNMPIGLLEQGRPEEILAEVRRQISVTGENGRFVVSTGEPIPAWVRPERVRFFCDSTRLI